MIQRPKILATLIVVATIALCLQTTTAFIQCHASHFDLIGTYSLGKQDEFNCTFKKLNQKIGTLDNVTFNSSSTTQYTIYNARPTFFYRDSKQKAEVLGNDLIVVYGGQVEARVTFNWTKRSLIQRNGTGQAFGLSDVLQLAKNITVQNDSSYSYDLVDASDVEFLSSGSPFSLTRYDPADITDDDRTVLTKMLNNILGVKTIRNLLEDEVHKAYRFYLGACLHGEHHHIDSQFDYKWVPSAIGKPPITISMLRKPYTIDIQKDGIRATFQVQAEESTSQNWKCGNRTVPILPLFPKVYGSTQQFVSYDFYENMIRFGISKGYLDTDLKREWWQSKMFQFYAGDLYEIFPLLASKFYANTEVNGNCKPTYTGLKVWKSGYDTFNVSIHFDCELNIQREKFLDFSVGLTLVVTGVPQQTNITFRLVGHEEFVTFYPYGQFQMKNDDLARLMISNSLNTLYNTDLYGSGFPQFPPRDYPHFIAQENYTIVYDSTHVDPHMQTLDQKSYQMIVRIMNLDSIKTSKYLNFQSQNLNYISDLDLTSGSQQLSRLSLFIMFLILHCLLLIFRRFLFMEIKYLDKTIVFQNKQKTYNKVKQFVLQQLPQLETKKWTFIYFDSEGDQVILRQDDEFQSTIDYYNSIQKELILIVKEMWWKHKKVHSKSKIVKQLLSNKELDFNSFKVDSFKLLDSDSDDEFVNIDFKPSQRYVNDSNENIKQQIEQQSQIKSKNFLLEETSEKCCYIATQVQNRELQECQGQCFQFSIQNKQLVQKKAQMINP